MVWAVHLWPHLGSGNLYLCSALLLFAWTIHVPKMYGNGGRKGALSYLCYSLSIPYTIQRLQWIDSHSFLHALLQGCFLMYYFNGSQVLIQHLFEMKEYCFPVGKISVINKMWSGVTKIINDRTEVEFRFTCLCAVLVSPEKNVSWMSLFSGHYECLALFHIKFCREHAVDV